MTAPVSTDALTERQREIVTLVARGLDNASIASALSLSPATVRPIVAILVAQQRFPRAVG